MARIEKLIMVTGEENHNKVYELIDNENGTCTAKWGRVGAALQECNYPISEFEKKLKEKVKKGYRVITDLLSVEKSDGKTTTTDDEEVKIQNMSREAMELINFLQSCAKGIVKQNYTVKVADVTQKQIDAAQAILDGLVALSNQNWSREEANKILLDLYNTIPRKMSNTKNFLIQIDNITKKRLQELISSEADLLDVMRGQVQTTNVAPKSSTGEVKLDIEIRLATPDEIDEISKKTDFDVRSAARIYRVENTKTKNRYESINKQNEQLLYHGSRSQNWWSIINGGLKIRPTNAVHTGSMFSDGIYAADKAQKSLGYTDGGYWTGSSGSSKRFLGIYSFNLGRQWDLFAGGQRHASWMMQLNLKKINDKGFDSLFAKGGADLRNNEMIVFEEARCTIKYLIEMR